MSVREWSTYPHSCITVVCTLQQFLLLDNVVDLTSKILLIIALFFNFFFSGADIAELMMDFVEWLTNQEFGRQCILSVRDILSWVNFMNVMVKGEGMDSANEHNLLYISPMMSFVHAACLVYIDGIGSGKSFSTDLVTKK